MKILILFLICSYQINASILDEIKSEKQILVGTTGDYPPFSYQKKGQRTFEGLDIDLAKNLAKELQVKVKFVKTTWKTLLSDLHKQKFDLALSGISKKLHRQEVGFFSTGYMENGKLPILRCKDKEKFKSLKDIDKRSVKVIFNPGGTNESFAKEKLKSAELIHFPDNRFIFKEIINGKVDLMITDSVEAKYQSKIHNGVLCPWQMGTLTQGEIAVLMPRDVVLKEYVNTWLYLLKRKGTLEKLKSKYLSP